MQLPAFSPNTLIIAILVVALLYGLIAGKHRLRIFILSIYVGIVIAERLGIFARPYLGMLGEDQVNLILLGVPIILFGLIPWHHGKSHRDKGSAIANMIVGVLAGALIIGSALHLVPTSELSAIDGESFVAMILQQYYLWFLGLVPLVVLLLGLIKPKEPKHH